LGVLAGGWRGLQVDDNGALAVRCTSLYANVRQLMTLIVIKIHTNDNAIKHADD
jgi:hypothetical protein